VQWCFAHPRFTACACFVLGSLGSAYLWAALAGNGVAGLEGTKDVSNATGFPGANVVFIVAIVVVTGATIFASLWAPARFRLSSGRLGPAGWAAIYVVVGGACFGVRRLVA
jgi:hypothetical protein